MSNHFVLESQTQTLLNQMSFWEFKGIPYEPMPDGWYTSNDPLAIEYREWSKTVTKRVHDLLQTKGVCASCIHLYDESITTACMKNGRWVTVEVEQLCDIEAWEGFDL